jgi:hypothetical protein
MGALYPVTAALFCTVFWKTAPVATGSTGELSEAWSLSEAALSAYVADRHEPSDGDGDGNSAVPKSHPNIPNIPNTVRAAALHKAARGSLAGDS